MRRRHHNSNITEAIEKRFQTAMIGSLARVEDYLGFVWGHNKETISVQQAENRQLWEELREEILDHSNYQMRCALNDLRKTLQTMMSEDSYKETIVIKQPNEELGDRQ